MKNFKNRNMQDFMIISFFTLLVIYANEYIKQYSDSIMVVITFVYVVATIEICRANIKAAEASKEQLAEMRKQYDEENRANIEVELVFEKRAFWVLRFINHGKLNAQNVKIVLSEDFLNAIKGTKFYSLLQNQSKKNCVIGVGQKYDLIFAHDSINQKIPVSGKVVYESNGEIYSTEFNIDFENYATIFSFNSEQEDYLTEIKRQNKELNEINKTLRKLTAIMGEDKNNE